MAGILRSRGASARIVDLATDGALTVLYSGATFAEYRNVLRRPELGLNQERVAMVLRQLRRHGTPVRRRGRRFGTELPDESDRPFLQVAVTGKANVILTSNLRHFPTERGIRVLTPGQFMAELRAERAQDA